MKYSVKPRCWVVIRTLLSIAVFVFSLACHSTNGSDVTTSNASAASPDQVHEKKPGPNIQITEVPGAGAGPDKLETIAGKVSGIKVNECKVVVFARTNTWYVQPYIDASDITIADDYTWRTDTHLGHQYAALLVKADYKPPSTTPKLPPVGGLVLAVAIVDARK